MDTTSYQYQNQQNHSSKSKLVVIIGLVMLIAAMIGGTVLFMRQPKKMVEKTVVTVTKAPTPTEKPKLDKSKVKIQVINGSGVAGQASIVIKALTDAGYNADNVESTNASTFENTVTTVTAKVNFDEAANDIADILKPTFSNIAVSSSKLDDANTFDIVVLTGSDIPNTPTATLPTESTSSSSSSSSGTTPTINPTLSPTPTP